MKSFRQEPGFNLHERVGFVNITPQVEAALGKSGIREGLVLVNAMHITASEFINDDERGLQQDYGQWLERPAPTTRRANTATTTPARITPMPI